MSSLDGRFAELARAASALAGELTLDHVLETIVLAAVRVTGARYAALGVIGRHKTLTRFITEGADEETIAAIGHYPTGKGLLGALIRDPRTLRLEDITDHPASAGFPEHHPPMENFLGGPVRSGGKVFGNLYLTEKPGGFTAEDEQLLAVLAAQAGTAIENALLAERLQSLAVQEERARISRDLHDGVIQSLFSVGMTLEAARQTSDASALENRVDEAINGIDAAIRDLRGTILGLQAHRASELGLAAGLAELTREHEVNALVRPMLRVDGEVDTAVAPEVAAELLHIVRESLVNVRRHASANRVAVGATVTPEALVVTITDDGRGFTTTRAALGRGVANMRARTEALGGTIRIESAPSSGTVVQVRIPRTEGG